MEHGANFEPGSTRRHALSPHPVDIEWAQYGANVATRARTADGSGGASSQAACLSP
jgi:hypothetical protein